MKKYYIEIKNRSTGMFDNYSKYLQLPLVINEKADEQYDSIALTLSYMKKDVPFKKGTILRVRIIDSRGGDEKYETIYPHVDITTPPDVFAYFVIENDSVQKVNVGSKKEYYSHNIEGYEETKLLDNIFIDNFTITGKRTGNFKKADSSEIENMNVISGNNVYTNRNDSSANTKYYEQYGTERNDGWKNFANRYFYSNTKNISDIARYTFFGKIKCLSGSDETPNPGQPWIPKNGNSFSMFYDTISYSITDPVFSYDKTKIYLPVIEKDSSKPSPYYSISNRGSGGQFEQSTSNVSERILLKYEYRKQTSEGWKCIGYCLPHEKRTWIPSEAVDAADKNRLKMDSQVGLPYFAFDAQEKGAYQFRSTTFINTPRNYKVISDAFNLKYVQGLAVPGFEYVVGEDMAADYITAMNNIYYRNKGFFHVSPNAQIATYIDSAVNNIVAVQKDQFSRRPGNLPYGDAQVAISAFYNISSGDVDVVGKTLYEYLTKVISMIDPSYGKFNFQIPEKYETQIVPEETFSYSDSVSQILFEIGKVIRAVPKLKDNIIYFENISDKLKFSSLGELINKYDDYRYETNSAEYQTSSYITDVKKAINDDGGTRQISSYYPGKDLFTKVRAEDPDEGMSTCDNAGINIATSGGIYSVISLKVKNFLKNHPDVIIDITPFLYEKSAYESLSAVLSGNSQTPSKGNAVYFSQGGTTINISSVTEPQKAQIFAATTSYAIERICAIMTNETLIFSDVPFINIPTADDQRNTISNYINPPVEMEFNVEYVDMISTTLRTENFINDDQNTRSLIYNVPGTTQSSQALSELLQSEIQKRSQNDINKTILIKQNDVLPQIGWELENENGKYYIDDIVYNFNNKQTIANVNYTQSINKITSLIKIPTEKRYYTIYTNSLVDRTIHLNEYTYISSDKTIAGKQVGGFSDRIFDYPGTIGGKSYEPSQFAVVLFKRKNKKCIVIDNDIVYPLVLSISPTTISNGLLFHTSFYDNFSAGAYVNTKLKNWEYVDDTVDYKGVLSDSVQSGRIQKYARYVDEYGDAEIMSYYILKSDPTISKKYNTRFFPYYVKEARNVSLALAHNEGIISPVNEETITKKDIFFTDSFLQELRKDSSIYFEDVEIFKDNREKLQVDFQMNYITEDPHIHWNSHFSKNMIGKSKKIKCYLSDYTAVFNKYLDTNYFHSQYIFTVSSANIEYGNNYTRLFNNTKYFPAFSNEFTNVCFVDEITNEILFSVDLGKKNDDGSISVPDVYFTTFRQKLNDVFGYKPIEINFATVPNDLFMRAESREGINIFPSTGWKKVETGYRVVLPSGTKVVFSYSSGSGPKLKLQDDDLIISSPVIIGYGTECILWSNCLCSTV